MSEPITIRTGLPGHGKTLNAIIEIDEQAANQNRLVYYHNINDLQLDKLKATWFEFNEPLEWFKLPENSIIVIDEAQRFFPVRDPRTVASEAITQLETIRHGGRELVLITQDHRLLDVNIRRLCGCHIHFKRLYGTSNITRYEFQAATDFDKASARKSGTFKIIKLNKNFFNVYKSAVNHHFKMKIPTRLLILPILVIACVYCIYTVLNSYRKEPEPEPSKETATQEQSSASNKTLLNSVMDKVTHTDAYTNRADKKPMTVQQYLDHYTPRLKNIPSTAPAYDEITKPVTYPKLSCMVSSGQHIMKVSKQTASFGTYDGKKAACQCFTQQGSKYKTDFEFCLNVVENGYFDPAKPDGFNTGKQDRFTSNKSGLGLSKVN